MISVLVATKNRPKNILSCVKSILTNTDKDFEIIVVDQSRGPETRDILKSIYDKRLVYKKITRGGKSISLNFGAKFARGNLLAFTDDDCLVERSWIRNINKGLKGKGDIVGLFGKVLPYRPKNHKGYFCPSTIVRKKKKIIDVPCKHWENLGFGNNMVIKRTAFEKVGGFNSWFGPGAFVKAAEDAEIALRLLVAKNAFIYDPGVSIWHNRWITKDEMLRVMLGYKCGEVACYGYYFLLGYDFAKEVIAENFSDLYYKFKKIVKNIIYLKLNFDFWQSIVYFLIELYLVLIGFGTAILFFLRHYLHKIYRAESFSRKTF